MSCNQKAIHLISILKRHVLLKVALIGCENILKWKQFCLSEDSALSDAMATRGGRSAQQWSRMRLQSGHRGGNLGPSFFFFPFSYFPWNRRLHCVFLADSVSFPLGCCDRKEQTIIITFSHEVLGPKTISRKLYAVCGEKLSFF